MCSNKKKEKGKKKEGLVVNLGDTVINLELEHQ